jgi:hypothetical protein
MNKKLNPDKNEAAIRQKGETDLLDGEGKARTF